jgi:hypothetical protein
LVFLLLELVAYRRQELKVFQLVLKDEQQGPEVYPWERKSDGACWVQLYVVVVIRLVE